MRDRVVEIYRALVAEHDDLAVKGAKSAYTAMNGNMFSFVDGDGLLCIRLSNEDKAAFEAAHGTGDVIQHGAVMRGYVPVPEAMLEDMGDIAGSFCESRRKRQKSETKTDQEKEIEPAAT